MRDHRLQKSLASPSSPARPSQCAPSGAHAPKCLGTLRRAVLMGTLCMHVHGLTVQRLCPLRRCLRPSSLQPTRPLLGYSQPELGRAFGAARALRPRPPQAASSRG